MLPLNLDSQTPEDKLNKFPFVTNQKKKKKPELKPGHYLSIKSLFLQEDIMSNVYTYIYMYI
jgi:hypothetical protein